MTEIDRFKFEDRNTDFPFYNNNPHIPIWGWIVLFIAGLIGFFLTGSNKPYFSIIGCVILIVPVLYFLKWDYKAIVKMPSRKDLLLIIVLFAAYMIYSSAIGPVLAQLGIVSGGTVDAATLSVWSSIGFLFSVLGEEFIKFIPFVFFLTVLYKYRGNRKLSIIISVALVILIFSSMHAYNYVMFLYALIIQGLGTIFEFYGYIKTKNLIVPFLCHLLTDEFILLITLLGLG